MRTGKTGAAGAAAGAAAAGAKPTARARAMDAALGSPLGAALLWLLIYALVMAADLTGLVNEYWLRVLDQSLIVAVASLGLSLIYGFCGQFSLGHAAFYGLGAYSAGLVGKAWGGGLAGLVLAMLAGAAVAAAVAFLLGLPVLRLRSDYLGIATLGFGIIVKVLLDLSGKVIPATGGATGMTGVPQTAHFTQIFLVFGLAVALVRNLVYSSYGRAFVAIREDELAADAVGVDTTRSKTLAFVAGCALAGLAGAMYAHRYPFIHPTNFDFLKSLDFLLVVVLGGLGSVSGTMVTAVAWVFLLEVLRVVLGAAFVDLRGVVYALVLVAVILIRPQGLLGGREWRLLLPREGPGHGPA